MAPGTLVLTQPALRTSAMAARLRARGIAVVHWPLSELSEAPGINWRHLVVELAACDWVLFPSPGAITVVLSGLERSALDWPPGPGIGLVGAGSAEALDAWSGRLPGLAQAVVATADGPVQDADALLSRAEFATLHHRRVAVMRRADAGERWISTLRARGAEVHAPLVYRSSPLQPPADAAAWVAARAAADAGFAVAVADTGSGDRLSRFVAAQPAGEWVLAQPMLTQHPRVAESLTAGGWRRVVLHAPGTAALVAALESLRVSQS